MSDSELEASLDHLVRLTDLISRADYSRVRELLDMPGADSVHPKVAELAEAFGMMMVQLEAREFRLECIIEDLLAARAELETAHLDPLTGLPNRAIFHDRIQQALERSQREGRPVALLFLDLDKFKPVNDRLGHDAGDALLVAVTERLRGCVRSEDTLARLGGDEFGAALMADSRARAEEVAERMVRELQRPFVLPQGEVQIGVSIGVARYPEDARSVVGLVKAADIAMYEAKAAGRNGYRFAS